MVVAERKRGNATAHRHPGAKLLGVRLLQSVGFTNGPAEAAVASTLQSLSAHSCSAIALWWSLVRAIIARADFDVQLISQDQQ